MGVLEATADPANLEALRHGLRALGYVEGRDLTIEHRSADGRTERLPDLARELVGLEVDILVTGGSAAALVARHVTATIPIVMASSGDPVFAGLVTSLARPGGNVTGHHGIVRPEVGGLQLRLLGEVAPGLTRVGVLMDTGDVYARLALREIEKTARDMGVKLQPLEASRPDDLDRLFEAALLNRIDGLLVLAGGITVVEPARIVSFAAMSRLPAVYGASEFVAAGGLMAHGTDLRDLFRRSAAYVHRILQGARPADLPVEAPSKLEIVINLKTARSLGIAIPPALLRRADRVVE